MWPANWWCSAESGRQLNAEQSCFRANNRSCRKHYISSLYECRKTRTNPGFKTTKSLSWKEMEMRRRGAPDLSGICFQMSSNSGLFVNCWWNSKHAYADTNSVFLNNIIYFHVLQEILQYGRSFDVEKTLSDERYQTLKVSRWKTTHSLALSISVLLNCCESDLHFLSLKETELFKTLNANPFCEEPVVSEYVFLITSLPCFLPAVHKCVWGWTQDGWEVVPPRAALLQRHSGRP